jgi:lysophospholipase L1-like esterase
MTGDSLVSNGYHSLYYDDGPSGEAPLQPLFALQQQLDPGGLTFQNLGKGSTQTSWALSTGIPAALATGTDNIVLKSGINDLAAGATWAQVKANLDGIKALCAKAAHAPSLFVVSLSPDGTFTDDQAETARIWNMKMRTWCEVNGATFVDTYNVMGQVRNSTGCYDNLHPAYDRGDGVHYNAAGAAKLGSLIAEAIGRKYSGPEIGPIPQSAGVAVASIAADDGAAKFASYGSGVKALLSNSAL